MYSCSTGWDFSLYFVSCVYYLYPWILFCGVYVLYLLIVLCSCFIYKVRCMCIGFVELLLRAGCFQRRMGPICLFSTQVVLRVECRINSRAQYLAP